MYYGRNEIPKEGTLLICRCPYWCDSGYQIAEYKNGKFCYDDQSTDAFDDNVIAWTPLNEDGEQTESIHKVNSDKWDDLEEKVTRCFPNYDDDGNELPADEPEADLCTIGELASIAFGFM